MRRGAILTCLALISALKSCDQTGPGPTPPLHPVHEIDYTVLDKRQSGLFLTYPGVNAAGAGVFWMGPPFDLSQRVEFAGGSKAIEEIENTAKWQALATIAKIHGSEPNSSSEEQFNIEVAWDKDAPSRFEKLPNWSEHIALLHPGQYGYQENRDGNPFLGLVVLFDENPANPNQPTGQFHIGFRSFFGHYEPENGDIGNPDNYRLYARWHGYIGSFVPAQ